MRETETLCTFIVDRLFLAIDVGDVEEVLLSQPLTSVPRAHPVVAGLINMRGQIVVAVDLRVVLGRPPRAPGLPPPVNVIVRSGRELIGVLVDQVGEVMEVETRWFTPPPDNIPPATRDLFRGVYQLPQQLLLVIDTSRAIESMVSQANAAQSKPLAFP